MCLSSSHPNPTFCAEVGVSSGLGSLLDFHRALLGGSFLAIVDSEQAKRRWESHLALALAEGRRHRCPFEVGLFKNRWHWFRLGLFHYQGHLFFQRATYGMRPFQPSQAGFMGFGLVQIPARCFWWAPTRFLPLGNGVRRNGPLDSGLSCLRVPFLRFTITLDTFRNPSEPYAATAPDLPSSRPSFLCSSTGQFGRCVRLTNQCSKSAQAEASSACRPSTLRGG